MGRPSKCSERTDWTSGSGLSHSRTDFDFLAVLQTMIELLTNFVRETSDLADACHKYFKFLTKNVAGGVRHPASHRRSTEDLKNRDKCRKQSRLHRRARRKYCSSVRILRK